MTETLQPVDLLAIALALAALIGCINCLWVKLPPAIGMLLGSLVRSAGRDLCGLLFTIVVQGLTMSDFLQALYGGKTPAELPMPVAAPHADK